MEENPDARKYLVAATKISSIITSSHFISIAMRNHSKLSIKIPKFMDKAMHGRSRRTKRGHQFPKKVVSVFSSVFGRKRSLSKTNEDHNDSESLLEMNDSHDGKEKHSTAEGNDLVHHQRIVGPLSQLIKLDLDNAHDAAEEGKHKQAVVALANKNYNGEAARERTDVVSGWGVWRIKVRSCRLIRVVLRIVSITSWLKKKVREEVGEEGKGEEEDDEAWLCKKRILMGGRCKPLDSSGALHYDSDGILIPDQLL